MKRTGSIGFIFITILIDVLGFGLVIPVMPKFVQMLSHGGTDIGARYYGLLLSLFGLMQFIFSPLLGCLSDRYGRRPILLISLFFNGIDYIILALANSIPWLFVGRTLTGITSASFTTASAYIADVSKPEERAQNFGIIGAAFGLGFIIGPAIGGMLGHYDPRAPFWGGAILSLANLLYGYFILPESLKPENRRQFKLREANPVGALAMLGKYPVVWGLTGAIVTSTLGHQFLQCTWVLCQKNRN